MYGRPYKCTCSETEGLLIDSERRSLSSRTKGNPAGRRTADNETLDGFLRASATGSGRD